MKEFKNQLIEFLSFYYEIPIYMLKLYLKFFGVIKYDTLIMTKNKQIAFKAFMDFGNIKESPELCMFAVNEYFYSFHNLTGEEFIMIIKWEIDHDNL